MQATIFLSEQKQEEPAPRDQTQPAPTALAPIEEPIIDGEVTATIEPEQKIPPKSRPYYLIVVGTVLACLLFLSVSQLLPLLSPTATVVIIPREQSISTTAAIPIHGRELPALTLSQSTTVPATGHGYQEAERAHGYIILYNGSLTDQTIPAGTMLTGNDGIRIVTDQTGYIPPASPPSEGQVSVLAHAIVTGASGNIPAGDIYVALSSDVLARNFTHFRGGQDERTYTVVAKRDIATASSTVKATLLKSESAALAAQVSAGEALITPLCSEKITADHQAGEEAKEVMVMVSDTCSSVAYPIHDLRLFATQMITAKAMQCFGTGYRLAGDIKASIIHTTITDQGRGITTILVKLDAIFVYQINPVERKLIIHLIAGKSTQQAVKALFQLPGIQGAAINSNGSMLPIDAGSIHIIVMYRSR